MVTPREIFVPQAMQRHTGCAWVHPARAEENTEKPKPEAAADCRATGTREK